MSVKKNSVAGLDALIDIAAGTETGGATDDLGKGQVYVATIVAQVKSFSRDNLEFSASFSETDSKRTARLFKIKLQEELGNSRTGGELLPSTSADLTSMIPNANKEKRGETANFLLNLLPEGIFIAAETAEMPGLGDDVYATSDGGIEGRYVLTHKGGAPKGIKSGLLSPFDDASALSEGQQEAADWNKEHVYKDKNGEPVEKHVRKFKMLEFVQRVMVKAASSIKSDFGSRFHPIHKKVKPHQGVDISAAVGAELRAPVDGLITAAVFQGEVRGRWRGGNYIKMKHDDGTGNSMFLHLHTIAKTIRPLVDLNKSGETITDPFDTAQIPAAQLTGTEIKQKMRKGEERAGNRAGVEKIKVKKGDLLGTIGNSGSSTGPHLHWSTGTTDPYGIVLKWLKEA